MAYLIKDLLNVVIQHSSSLLEIVEWVTLLIAVITLFGEVFAVCGSSKYDAKHCIRKKAPNEGALIIALDLVIKAIHLLRGR